MQPTRPQHLHAASVPVVFLCDVPAGACATKALSAPTSTGCPPLPTTRPWPAQSAWTYSAGAATPRQTRPDMQHAHVSSSRAGSADSSSVAAYCCSRAVCREKMPAGLENKKGAGSYELDMTTLYVHYGGAGHYAVPQLRHLLLEVRIHRSSLVSPAAGYIASTLPAAALHHHQHVNSARQEDCCRAAATGRAQHSCRCSAAPCGAFLSPTSSIERLHAPPVCRCWSVAEFW